MFKFLRDIFQGWSDDQDLKQNSIQNKHKYYPSSTGLRDVKTNEHILHIDVSNGEVMTKSNQAMIMRRDSAKLHEMLEREKQRKIDLIPDLERCLGHTVLEPQIIFWGDEFRAARIRVKKNKGNGTSAWIEYTELFQKDGWYLSRGGKYKVYKRK